MTTANANLWPNATKIAYVRNAFNNRLRAQLIDAFYKDLTIYSRFVTKYKQFSSQMEIIGIWKKKNGKKKMLGQFTKSLPSPSRKKWNKSPHLTIPPELTLFVAIDTIPRTPMNTHPPVRRIATCLANVPNGLIIEK
jgi:hypothetical protein